MLPALAFLLNLLKLFHAACPYCRCVDMEVTGVRLGPILSSNWDVGGHPPLRGSPIYPVGHPGYFNGRHIVSS
jgi:hypothetical protein